MNRALLAEIQRQSGYPCVTLLHPTTPGPRMAPADITGLEHLCETVDRRLAGDVSEEARQQVSMSLRRALHECATERTTAAIAICVSLDYTAVVHLGRTVRPRQIVDTTFATRDMVADAARTATFRVITVSDHMARLLVGDRHRLAEERTQVWPLYRDEGQTLAQWSRAVSHAVRVEHSEYPMPTVLAGVERSLREILKLDKMSVVGTLAGNHDRTGWAELHAHTWPKMSEWLGRDRQRARLSLDQARGARRYAGGIDEVWDLAHEGRVALLVVEETFDYPARLAEGRLRAAHDVESPDVLDDAVDELIETVLRLGGDAVILPEGELAEHGRLAAVLRY
ncbi:MAG: hypothetical protein WCC60_23325 [Ilumatobacteraceae bacterium]